MIRYLAVLLVSGVFVVAAAFIWFVSAMPGTATDEAIKADAIIVLTGGNGRVEKGLIALANGDAPVLFISGVGERTTRRQILLAHAKPDIRARIAERDAEIVLDYVASSTRSNADQTTEFVRERELHSIRLVTAFYHMPRSLLEFRSQMPDVEIIADPVFPDGYGKYSWAWNKTARRLVFSEFKKYYAALFLRTRV